ncbi:MAG: chloride channel protein [Candidatus Heimdallarchaeaceae archaeon]
MKAPKMKKLINLTPVAKRWLLIDLLGIVVGILGGLGAVLFRFIIKYVQIFFFEIILPLITIQVGGYNLGYVFLPVIGALIIGPLIVKFAKETKGHGVPEVLEAVALREGNIRKRVAFFKIGVSAITIGSGGSAGREGPIAQIGSTIGSYIGQIFNLEPQQKKLLVVCGLSAGIAGTFNAPLGGAIFGMEILLRGIGIFNAMPVILASVVGVAVSAAILGQETAFHLSDIVLWKPQELPLFLLLGVIFGLISVIWVKVFYGSETIFEKMKIPESLKMSVGGLLTGVLIMFFPIYGIAGVGYEGIDLALAGSLAIGLAFLLGAIKILATSFTIGSGGSGGIFAPSLFIGAMFGVGFGGLFKLAFPSLVEQTYTYGLAGMAALFAGAAQAPFNVIFMIPEMSNDYALMPPIMLASFTSFFVTWLFLKGSSIYTIKLQRRGINIKMGSPYILDLVDAKEVMTEKVVEIGAEMPLSILELYNLEHHHTGYPVTKDGKLVGIVTMNDIPNEGMDTKNLTVADIMSKTVITVNPDNKIKEVLEKMNEHKVGRLPVVKNDEPDLIVGIITRQDVFEAIRLAALRTESETE